MFPSSLYCASFLPREGAMGEVTYYSWLPPISFVPWNLVSPHSEYIDGSEEQFEGPGNTDVKTAENQMPSPLLSAGPTVLVGAAL